MATRRSRPALPSRPFVASRKARVHRPLPAGGSKPPIGLASAVGPLPPGAEEAACCDRVHRFGPEGAAALHPAPAADDSATALDKRPMVVPPRWGLAAQPWMQRLWSDDVDEVTQALRSQYEHSRVVHRRGPLGFRACWAQGEQVGLGTFQAGLPQTLRGVLDYTVIHLGAPLGTTYQVGRRTWTVATSDTVGVLPPDWEYTRHLPAGRTFWLGLGRQLLEGEFNARLGPRPAGWRCGLQAVQVQAPLLAALTPAVDAVAIALQPEAAPRQLAHARAGLVARVVDCLMPHLAVTPQRDVPLARLQRLEAWVDGHVDTPISLGTLCDLAGVGERSLQKAFEARRGVSPMRFVVERRLEAARRRLENGVAGSVTRVALDLGFDHLGRFASEYRALFGESPSAALWRRRRRSDFGLPA